MTCRILTLQNEQEWPKAAQWLQGRSNPGDGVENAVRDILAAVRDKGDEALVDFTRRFDCPDFAPPLRVSEQEIARAAASVSVESREQISGAAANIRAFHEAQLEKSWFLTRPDGSILGQRVLPVDAVGLYVPGGQGGNTPLVSSLLMNAIPAQVAGVPRLAVCTPPRKDGSVNPHILAAAHLLDIDEVYRVGGAWSIAALAYGTQSLPPVDVIAGPGNIYVTTAKRLVQGTVGIDMIAGPSEVLVLADSSANVSWIAADMLSQAEHDPLASAICVTDDPRLAESLQQELDNQYVSLPRAQIAGRSLMDWGAIVVVPNLSVAVAVANRSIWKSAPATLGPCCRTSAMRARSSWGSTAPKPWAIITPVPTMCCPLWARRVFPRPFPCRPSAKKPASWPPRRPSCCKMPRPSPLWPVWKAWRPMPARWKPAGTNRA